MADAVAGFSPLEAEAIRNSVGAATQIATSLPPELGQPLAKAAGIAFTEAIGLAVLIGIVIALIGAVLVIRFMPPRHLPVEESQTLDSSS
ncbi:MAG: hypothetical protein ABID84_05495 [Chloroflexota bacterium]